jgi:hypothetical protein
MNSASLTFEGFINKYAGLKNTKFKNMDRRFSASRRISHRLRAGRPQTEDGRGPELEFEPISINDFDLLAKKRIIMFKNHTYDQK